MLKRMIYAYHLMKAFDEEWTLGSEAALRRIARAEAASPLRFGAAAYKAYLLFHSGQTSAADALFEDVERCVTPPRNANEAYVRLYCQFFGRFRVASLQDADAIWTEAQAVNCSAWLRRRLPLYDKPSVVHADPRHADLDTSPVSHRYRRRHG